MTNKGKALGIDYGDKRIGIAVSDNQQQVAFARDYISNTSKAEVIQKIKTLCEQDQITLIVVGLPLNMDSEDTQQTEKVRKFTEELRQAVNQEIVLHDERLTTKSSDDLLTEMGMKTPEKREQKDSLSAVLILQNYLDVCSNQRG